MILSTSSEKDISVAFEKLAITHSDINANINIPHFKPKILEAIDHLKSMSHKRSDVDSVFDFITKSTASNITKEALADIITDLVKQNIIINKKSVNGRESFRRNTLEVFSTTDEISDTDNTQPQNEKDHKHNDKLNSSVQQPTHSFIETDIHTLSSCQQLAPKTITDTSSLNTITEISLTVPTDIQTPITANNLNDTSNFTQKSMLKIEAQLSALKSYVDCELSMLTSKIDALSDSLKHALTSLQKRESNHANTDILQQSIASLENELKSKDRIIQSLLETRNTLTNSLSTPKAKQPEPIINLSQQQQRQHQQHQQQQSQTQQALEQSQRIQSSRQQKQQGLSNEKQTWSFLVKMNLTYYMLEICLKRSMKVTYLNYLVYAQQIISVTTLTSKCHFLKILGKKRLCLCKSA